MNTEMLNNKSLIENLKAEVAKNDTFKSMCVVFAMRKRTRSDIRIPSLIQKMEKEGFAHTKEEYQACLAFMASQNLGVLEKDKKGAPKSLKHITLSLPSIGKAALQDEDLKAFKKPKRFLKLLPSIPKPEVEPGIINMPLKVQVKGLTIEIPSNTSTKDVVSIINKLRA